MKQKYLYILIINLFLLFNLKAQISGTFIAYAICQNGILFIADSRSTIMHDSIKYGYFDGLKKFRITKGLFFSSSGVNGFGIKSSLYISELYEKSTYYKNGIKNYLKGYIEFVDSKTSKYDYSIWRNNIRLFAGGFDKFGEPTICLESESHSLCINKGYITSFNIDELPLPTEYTLDEYRKIVINYLYSHIEQNNLEHSVGGPYTIVEIKKNSINYIQRPNLKNYDTTCHVFKDLLDNKIQFNLNDVEKDQFIAFLKKRLLELNCVEILKKKNNY